MTGLLQKYCNFLSKLGSCLGSVWLSIGARRVQAQKLDVIFACAARVARSPHVASRRRLPKAWVINLQRRPGVDVRPWRRRSAKLGHFSIKTQGELQSNCRNVSMCSNGCILLLGGSANFSRPDSSQTMVCFPAGPHRKKDSPTPSCPQPSSRKDRWSEVECCLKRIPGHQVMRRRDEHDVDRCFCLEPPQLWTVTSGDEPTVPDQHGVVVGASNWDFWAGRRL